jgi:hypothetical protein
MKCTTKSVICHAAPPPVDLGQRGVVLRCFEALTGDGQLLVSPAAAVHELDCYMYCKVLSLESCPWVVVCLRAHGALAQVDLFVNYDCDLEGANLFERMVTALVRIAQTSASPDAPVPQQEEERALRVLVRHAPSSAVLTDIWLFAAKSELCRWRRSAGTAGTCLDGMYKRLVATYCRRCSAA